MRRFQKLTEAQRRRTLLSCLVHAIDDRYDNRKTDLVGIACQYGGAWRVRREDFEDICGITVGELVAYFEKDGATCRAAARGQAPAPTASR